MEEENKVSGIDQEDHNELLHISSTANDIPLDVDKTEEYDINNGNNISFQPESKQIGCNLNNNNLNCNKRKFSSDRY